MVEAKKENLVIFFDSNIQYIVPFFQRSYVWTEENWETLWDNIINIVNQKGTLEHFIGTIITKQKPAKQIGEQQYDLIDGQQRLTTISILLKAMHDSCKNGGELANLKTILKELITIKNVGGHSPLKIELSKYDKMFFEVLLNDSDPMENIDQYKDCRIFEAYKFFHDKVKEYSNEELDELRNNILFKMPVVSMLLGPEDDEQVIFDTINSLGVKLTIAELLKNHIFQDNSLHELYEDYWGNVFERDEEQLNFWEQDKTVGRISRTNIEIFLYCFLIIETQKEVKLETLFKEYKNWLKDKDLSQKKQFLKKLKEYAEIYFKFPKSEELNTISYSETIHLFFHIIENLSVNTIYPLILFLFKKVKDEQEKEEILKYLGSYIVRRNICRYTTKNYNHLFVSIIRSLMKKKDEGISLSDIKEIISNYGDESNIFPDDSALENGFHKSLLPNQNAREILFCIALYQRYQDESKHDTKVLSLNSYSVEHIMPKKWEENWNQSNLSPEEKNTKWTKLLTLGNLTLVRGRLNSALKNAAWEDKKKTLKEFSSLSITTNYLNVVTWDENAIKKRANDLFKNAVEIWKADS